jgi:hypothetical protein
LVNSPYQFLLYDVRRVSHLALGLAAVAARMEPGERARVCAAAAAHLTQAMSKTYDLDGLGSLAQGLAAVAARLEPGPAMETAATLAQAAARITHPTLPKELAQRYTDAITTRSPTGSVLTVVAVVAGRAGGPDLPATLALLALATEPPPCRLTSQQLVDLLKHPLFVGDARRVVLDQLGNRYRLHFADVWEFVVYAEEHLPDIDLRSPPKRP